MWLYSPRGPRAAKLKAKWVGPLRVTQVPSPQVRALEVQPGAAPVMVSVNRLKPYVEWAPAPTTAPALAEPVAGERAALLRLGDAAEETAAATVRALCATPCC